MCQDNVFMLLGLSNDYLLDCPSGKAQPQVPAKDQNKQAAYAYKSKHVEVLFSQGLLMCFAGYQSRQARATRQHHASALIGHLHATGQRFGHRRPLPVPERLGKPAALSQQPHPLLLLHPAVPVQ